MPPRFLHSQPVILDLLWGIGVTQFTFFIQNNRLLVHSLLEVHIMCDALRWNMDLQGMGANMFRIRVAALCLLASVLTLSGRAYADSTEVIVESVTGSVLVYLSDKNTRDDAITPNVGDVFDPPLTIETGTDGSIALRVHNDVISVAPASSIVIPESTTTGRGWLNRVLHNLGSAFYDIEARGEANFRVETPYLVSVVKGTSFNVTVSSDRTTVALVEGRLAISTPDFSDEVELLAGQIAVRGRGSEIRIYDDNVGSLETDIVSIGSGLSGQPVDVVASPMPVLPTGIDGDPDFGNGNNLEPVELTPTLIDIDSTEEIIALPLPPLPLPLPLPPNPVVPNNPGGGNIIVTVPGTTKGGVPLDPEPPDG